MDFETLLNSSKDVIKAYLNNPEELKKYLRIHMRLNI